MQKSHLHDVAVLLALGLTACTGPSQLSRHRSSLLDFPDEPRTPEARARHIPSGAGSAPGEIVEPSRGESLARHAADHLGKGALVANGVRFPDDCTGLVRVTYAEHGIDLLADGAEASDNGVTAIYRYAAKHGLIHGDEPRPGDLVFFRETYDRNRDGRENDGLTHVGIVETIERDGTLTLIHRVDRGVVRERMNLQHPGLRKDPASGAVINDWLRPGKRPRLASELFAGFGTLVKAPPALVERPAASPPRGRAKRPRP